LGSIALVVGDGSWAQLGEKHFNELCAEYGKPNTLSYQLPDGKTFYLFKTADYVFEHLLQPGITCYSGGDSLPAYPSMVEGKQVKKLGTATSIQNITDWVAGNAGSTPSPLTNLETVAEIDAVKVDDSALPIQTVVNEVVEVAEPLEVNISPGAGQAPVLGVIAAVGDSFTVLKNEVLVWANAGGGKTQVLIKALDWNREHGTQVKIEEIVNLVEEHVTTAPVEVKSLVGENLLFRLTEDATLFHDELEDPYFFFEGVSFKAPSKDFEGIIQHKYFKKTGQMPKVKELKNVMAVLKSKAKYEGPQVNLKNRVSAKDGAIIYDLHDKRHLKATTHGWGIIPASPLFYRYNHQQKQVEPVPGGNPWKVLEFLPVNEENQLLIMVYLISLFIPRIAHPVLAVF